MSPPDGGAAPHGRPLRVVSERLTTEEAARTRATPSVTRFASHSAAADRAAASALTTVLPGVPDPARGTASPRTASGYATATVAPALPVLAPRSPRRRMAELVRLVFARRRTGRHRPETMTTQGWSMFAPQRRRPRQRWGRY